MIQMISYPSINQIGYVLSNAYSISFCYRYGKLTEYCDYINGNISLQISKNLHEKMNSRNISTEI